MTSAPSAGLPDRPDVLPLPLPRHGPFTPADAARLGIGRASLERMLREGRVVRLVRGVYLDATRECPPSVRAEALARALGPDRVVTGLTAAWLHGAAPRVLSWAGRVRTGTVPLEARSLRGRDVDAEDLVRIGPVCATTAVRTAIELGRSLGRDRAVAVVDALLRCRALSHAALLAGARQASGPGSVNVRTVAARSDARAAGPAESLLRLRWLDAQLPTPIPGFGCRGERLTLALPTHRFAAVLAGSVSPGHLTALRASGWRVVELRPSQVLDAPERVLGTHLEREFHQHLLGEVG